MMVQPIQLKQVALHVADSGATVGILGAWLGFISGILLPIGSVAGSIWLILRLYWALRDRRAAMKAKGAPRAD